MSSKRTSNVINDASFTTGEDDTNNIRTSTLWDAEGQTDGIAYDDDNGSYLEALPAKKPPAATAGTRSTYYTSFHHTGTEEHIIINNNNNTFVNQQPPPLSTTPSKRAANEYEQLLSSTIFSLLEKFVPALVQKQQRPSKDNDCSSDGTSRGLDIPVGGDNYCQSTTASFNNAEEFDNSNSNDRMTMLLDVESQSFENNNNNNNTPPYYNNEMKTPKVNNLKTTGLEEEEYDGAAAHNQQFHHQQRKDSTSSSEYLPQSAAKLLNTLQHTNFDRGAEEIMLSILSSNSSGSLDGGSGSGSSFSFNEDDNEGDDGKAAVTATKQPPPVVTKNNDQDGTTIITNHHNSFESSSSNHQQQQYNYDDDDFDDDTSLSGDMARLSTSIAHLQRDLDNIDMAQFETICLEDGDDQQQHGMYGGGSGRGNRWKHWIRKWLLSHGIVNDEKVLNQLLLSGTNNGGEDGSSSSSITPGRRGGFTIFDFERDYMLVLVLLLVFFVLLRNRFQTVNELLLFEDDNQDLFGGSSDW